MKYRVLNAEELSVLEDDLKAFLIVNGVDGSVWEKINQQDPEKAIQLIELFSETVLQKVYEKIQFLEFRSEKSCLVFKLNKEDIQLISLQLDPTSEASLATPESIHALLQNNNNHQLNIFQSQKTYIKNREEEIHEMLTQGCIPSSSEFWVSLENAFIV